MRIEKISLTIEFNQGKTVYDKSNQEFIRCCDHNDKDYQAILSTHNIIEVPCLSRYERDCISKRFLDEVVIAHYGRDPMVKKQLRTIQNIEPGNEKPDYDFHVLSFLEERRLESEYHAFFRKQVISIAIEWCVENGIPYDQR